MSCKHPSLYNNMCVVCGAKVSLGAQSDPKATNGNNVNGWKTALNVSGGKVLQLSAEEAASVSASKLTNLRNSKKLALVLDLDHTLLHAIQVEGQTPSRTSATARVIEGTTGIGSGDGTDENMVHHLPIEEIDRLTVKHLVMKKRPFLDEFLEKASEFCQMTVYTAGTRRYAEAVARVIDPARRYFADRIVSRCDVANIRADGNDKSLERIYPGDASMAVIMDDREDVWRGPQSAQLLLVRPFVHFDPRPSEAAAAAASAAGLTVVSDNAAAPLADALGTLSRGAVAGTGPNGGLPAISSPVITLCATASGEPAGRIAKVCPLYSFEHSSMDDQLRRCLQVLVRIHAEYYGIGIAAAAEGEGGQAAAEGGAVESKEGTANNAAASAASTAGRNDDSGTTSANESVSSGSSSSGVAGKTRSVSGILQGLKRKVLAGCTLTFSGLIPTNEENPRNHTLWRLAESLGAQVSTEVLPRTTHLISIHTQTQKVAAVLQRRASEVWVLHPDWLIYCRWSLSRCQEATFMLNQLPPGQPLPSPAMDYSPIAAPVASIAGAPSGGGGSGGNLLLAAPRGAPGGPGASSSEIYENQKKRAREAEQPSSSPKKPDAEDSMLVALKRLKAVGPPLSAGSQATSRGSALLSRPPLPLVAPSQQNGTGGDGSRLNRAPSPTDQQRKSFLFQQALPGGPSTAGGISSSIAPVGQNGQQSTGLMKPAAPIGVIKKKAGVLLLERDASAGELPAPSGRRGSAASEQPSASGVRGYSPGKVRLAGPGDIDRSFRLDADAAAGGDGYFAEPAQVQNGAVGERSADRRRRASSELEDGEVGGGSDADSSDGQSSSVGSHSAGTNSLLGEGDGDFQLYDEDEAGPGEGDDGDADSAADEGMLCCNDDQGSTCSATPLDGEETWGQRKLRRRREGRRDRAVQEEGLASSAAGDDAPEDSSDGGSSVDFVRAAEGGLLNGVPKVPSSLAMQRLHSSTGSLRSAAGHSSNAASSDDDDCSDFEVMMLRRRHLNAGAVVGGGALENPIVIDDEDAYSDSA